MNETLKEKTAKGLFWGGLSNGVQQLLNLVFGIFLARILNVEDYGMVGMLTIFSLIANSLQESGFTAALANKKEVRHEDYNAVFWFSILMSTTLYVVLFFCAPLIASFYGIPELTPLARYSFLGFLISSLGTAQSAYMFRNLMVRQRAISMTVSLTVSGTTGILLAYNGYAYWGIATQSLIYITGVTCGNWYFSGWRPTLIISLLPLRKMIGFSSRLLITNIFNNINHNILSVVLGKFYTKKEVGDFNQANKWNFMGYSMLTGIINGVAQPILANVVDDPERQRRVFRKMLRFTAFLSFPLLLGLSLVTPELITIAITNKWSFSAEILRILCIGSAFSSISSLYSNLIISKGKSHIYMWNTIVLGIIQVTVMIFSHSYGILTMIKLYVSINAAWLLIWQYFVWKEIHLSLSSALKDILPFVVIAGLSMYAANSIAHAFANIYAVFFIKITIATVIYIIIMWMSGSITFKESIHFLLKRKR